MSRKTGRIFNKFPGYIRTVLKYRLRGAREIYFFCVHFNYIFFFLYQTIYRRFMLCVSFKSTNTHNFSSGITRSIWEKYILSKWKIFYSSRNILAIKGLPSLFKIPSSQISSSLITIYIWTSARKLVSFWLVPYKNERREEKTRATRAVRITFILSFSSLSLRDSQRSVNTTKWRHIVPRVMAATCLSRCSYSMVNEIYRVLHPPVSPPSHTISPKNIKSKIHYQR